MHLCQRDAAGIVGHGLIRRIENQAELRFIVDCVNESGIQQRVFRFAMRAVTIIFHVRKVQQIIQSARVATGFQLNLIEAELTDVQTGFNEGIGRSPFRSDVDDSSGCIAVQGRCRPAKDFDLLYRAEIDAVGLALSVWQRFRNSVH